MLNICLFGKCFDLPVVDGIEDTACAAEGDGLGVVEDYSNFGTVNGATVDALLSDVGGIDYVRLLKRWEIDGVWFRAEGLCSWDEYLAADAGLQSPLHLLEGHSHLPFPPKVVLPFLVLIGGQDRDELNSPHPSSLVLHVHFSLLYRDPLLRFPPVPIVLRNSLHIIEGKGLLVPHMMQQLIERIPEFLRQSYALPAHKPLEHLDGLLEGAGVVCLPLPHEVRPEGVLLRLGTDQIEDIVDHFALVTLGVESLQRDGAGLDGVEGEVGVEPDLDPVGAGDAHHALLDADQSVEAEDVPEPEEAAAEDEEGVVRLQGGDVGEAVGDAFGDHLVAGALGAAEVVLLGTCVGGAVPAKSTSTSCWWRLATRKA